MTNDVCPEAVHEGLKADEAWWAAQPRTRIPYVTYELDEGDVTFECRNCSTCRSTLYRKVLSSSLAGRSDGLPG